MKTRTGTFAAVLVTVSSLVLAAIVGGLAFVYSGLYDIAARTPHLAVVRGLVSTLQERSVSFHARAIEAPPLDDPALVRRGLAAYRERCLVCHGAPGVARDPAGIGMNPDPPPLELAARRWSDGELYWIVANGLKMAGMPAYAPSEQPENLWAVVAFTRRMALLSPAGYRRMVAALEGRADSLGVAWIAPPPRPLPPHADPERGRSLMETRGCDACHLIPGLRGRQGQVGPPLDGWAERVYLAGSAVNTPETTVRFLLDPQSVEPGTAMPDVGLAPEEALHIAAYLFTLR